MPFYGPSGAAGAVTREGGNTTEATTTSTTAVDLLSASSLSIAAGSVVEMRCLAGKNNGSATEMDLGFKLNSTTVLSATAFGTGNARDENFIIQSRFIYGVTGYLNAGEFSAVGGSADAEVSNVLSRSFRSAAMPTVALTDVILVGQSDGTTTVRADELHIYSFATS